MFRRVMYTIFRENAILLAQNHLFFKPYYCVSFELSIFGIPVIVKLTLPVEHVILKFSIPFILVHQTLLQYSNQTHIAI